MALSATGLLLPFLITPAQERPAQPELGRGFRVVVFSADGQWLAAATGEPDERGQLLVWDVATKKPLFVHEEAKGIPCVAFSPDGQMLAAALYDHSAKLLDAKTGRVQATLREHTKEVRGVGFSPDSRTLATAGWDRTINLWDVPTRAVRLALKGHTDHIYAVTFSPDGRLLVSAGDDGRSFGTRPQAGRSSLGSTAILWRAASLGPPTVRLFLREVGTGPCGYGTLSLATYGPALISLPQSTG
jgi:WD40 repeat protein